MDNNESRRFESISVGDFLTDKLSQLPKEGENSFQKIYISALTAAQEGAKYFELLRPTKTKSLFFVPIALPNEKYGNSFNLNFGGGHGDPDANLYEDGKLVLKAPHDGWDRSLPCRHIRCTSLNRR